MVFAFGQVLITRDLPRNLTDRSAASLRTDSGAASLPLPFRRLQPLSHLLVFRGVQRPPLSRAVPFQRWSLMVMSMPRSMRHGRGELRLLRAWSDRAYMSAGRAAVATAATLTLRRAGSRVR